RFDQLLLLFSRTVIKTSPVVYGRVTPEKLAGVHHQRIQCSIEMNGSIDIVAGPGIIFSLYAADVGDSSSEVTDGSSLAEYPIRACPLGIDGRIAHFQQSRRHVLFQLGKIEYLVIAVVPVFERPVN